VLDGAALAAIWTGKIARWNDSAILSLNPNVTDLPNQDIVLSFMCVAFLSALRDFFSPSFF
jgi:ABC-type phosphate transport system substrate-binding protein